MHANSLMSEETVMIQQPMKIRYRRYMIFTKVAFCCAVVGVNPDNKLIKEVIIVPMSRSMQRKYLVTCTRAYRSKRDA